MQLLVKADSVHILAKQYLYNIGYKISRLELKIITFSIQWEAYLNS
jgi:hypothetical protein